MQRDTGDTPRRMPVDDGVVFWTTAFEAWLPLLALVAPLSLFLSALVRASGAGTLPGELFRISTYEAPIAGVGAAFYPATFIFQGKVVARKFPRAGVTVTAAGVLSTSFMVFIIAFGGLVAGYVEKGIDPSLLADFMSPAWSPGLIPNMLYNAANFVALVTASLACIYGNIGPWWCGWSMLLGTICSPVAQAAYFRIEVFYPLGTGLLTLSVSQLLLLLLLQQLVVVAAVLGHLAVVDVEAERVAEGPLHEHLEQIRRRRLSHHHRRKRPIYG